MPVAISSEDAEVNAAIRLDVTAASSEDIGSGTIAIGGAGVAGIAGTLILNTVYSGTDAHIGNNAIINRSVVGETVNVAAASDTNLITVGGNAGGAGAAAVGGSVDINIVKKQVDAYIGSSAEVYTSRDVIVSANSLERSAAAIFAGRGAGAAAVNGLANIHVIDNRTNAFIDQGAIVDSDGNVKVAAEDDTEVKAIELMGSGAGAAAVGGGIDVTTITNKTSAYIADNATVNARGNAGFMDINTGRLIGDSSVTFLYPFRHGHLPQDMHW